MALVPIFCDTCETVWASPSIIGGDAALVQMAGNKAGQCPNCGGDGSIPDGLFRLRDDQFQVVDSTPEWRGRLEHIMEILQQAKETQASPADVVSAVAQEVPELAPAVNAFLQQDAESRWLQRLNFLLLFFGTLIMYLDHRRGGGGISPADLQHVMEGVCDSLRQQPATPPTP